MSVLLGVNVDHVATLRQARGTIYPNPVQAALEAEVGGADGITVHLREDRRHIQPRDVELIKEKIKITLNLEMATTDDMVAFAKKIKPTYCCLVPERREELTTEGGLNVVAQEERIAAVCKELKSAGILVSLFIDPEEKQIDATVRCGAPIIEIHTGDYANAVTEKEKQQTLERIKAAAAYAQQKKLQVNAGHGLHYQNVGDIAAIKGMKELNIGHAIVAEAIFLGMKNAVAEMKRVINIFANSK
jgi:pyridoxine 5-phosphate synthase